MKWNGIKCVQESMNESIIDFNHQMGQATKRNNHIKAIECLDISINDRLNNN